jgi:hypothetical protein
MIEINTEYILANYFLLTDKPLTMKRLRELNNAIVAKFDSCVYIDISTQCLIHIVQLYSTWFDWSNDLFVRARNSEESYTKRSVELGFDRYIQDVLVLDF